jgi:phage terminase large subunit-like protein
VKTLGCLLAVVVLAASCGGSSTNLYSRGKSQACLASNGVRLGGALDFVATTSTGGAFRAHLADNDVTVVFGATAADADNINQAYHRFHSQNVGIDDVLRQQGNAVMLWHQHPSDADLNRVVACLE